MIINEYKIPDIVYNSNEDIPQGGSEFYSTKSRVENRLQRYTYPVGKERKISINGITHINKYGEPIYVKKFSSTTMDDAYRITYIKNSYYHSGIFKFIIQTIGKKNPKGGESMYQLMIKPKRRPSDYDDLINNVDVDLSCTCRDFRFVFLNAAYQGLFPHTSKFGIFPIRDRVGDDGTIIHHYTIYKPNSKPPYESPDIEAWNDTSLPRFKYDFYSGREDAPIRNPENRGAVCKHLVMLLDYMQGAGNFFHEIENISAEIPAREELFRKPDNKIFNYDETFFQNYDEEGMAKTLEEIRRIRTDKIDAALRINVYDLINNSVFNYDYILPNDLESIKASILQDLSNFDQYYINKAIDEELENTHYYLPPGWQEDYDTINNHFELIRDDIDSINFQAKLDTYDTNYNDDVDDIVKTFDTQSDIYNDIDMYELPPNVYNYPGKEFNDYTSDRDILTGESFKYIKGFNEFLND